MSDSPEDLVATPSQTVGPFFHVGLAAASDARRAGDASAGANRVRLRIRVVDGDGSPVPDALIEVWSSASFGRQPTDADGCCEIEIERVPYLNICLFARGLLRHLQTRAYFQSEFPEYEDAALALVPQARRHTLLARPDDRESARWLFDIRLQGDDETVFFDA